MRHIKPTVATYTLPAFWASYLVNGDPSGMSDREIRACDAYMARCPGSIVDVGEPYFSWSFDLNGGDAKGGDLAEYTALVLEA